MAKKRKHLRANPSNLTEGGGFDMTPMIDVTFLLIIFFMCVTELSDANKTKEIVLPVAEMAEVDEPIPGRLVVNVTKKGEVEVLSESKSLKELDTILRNEAVYSRKEGQEFPDRAVFIRADHRVEFKHVQKVMSMCMSHKLWRIAFTTADPTASY
jgi:biopolymer transport protein ExbD